MGMDFDIEQNFIACANEFNEARYLWHHYMDEHIARYGMPPLYVGCVNYAYDREYDIDKALERVKNYPIDKVEAYLTQEAEWLQKWTFPGRYTIALYPEFQILNILGEQLGMTDVSSYAVSDDNDEVIFAIRIKHSGFRTIRIHKDAIRAQSELKSILDACVNMPGSSSSYDRLEDMKPMIDTKNKSKYLSFFGISLGIPAKEFLYAVNQLDNSKYNLQLKNYTQGGLDFCTDVEGYEMEWRFSTSIESHNDFVFDTIDGNSDNIEGYENIRKVYDKLLSYMTQQFGEPDDQDDVPSNLRKTSILKALRDGDYEIKSSFETNHIEASIELIADDDEKKCGRIYIEAYDKRLQKINSAAYKPIKANEEYNILATSNVKSASESYGEKIEQTRPKNKDPEEDTGCLIAASIVISLPLAAIPAYFCAAFSVGDTSEEFPAEFAITYIIFALIFIAIGYFSVKYGGNVPYSTGRGKRSQGYSFWSVPKGRSLTAGWKIKKYDPAGWRKKNGTNLFKSSGRRSKWGF